MKDIKNYPSLPGSAENAPEVVAPEKIAEIGVNTGAYAVREKDQISFDADEAVVKQKLPRSENFAYYVTCTRNGKPSFISASQLIRRAYDKDGNFEYVGPLQAELGVLPSLKERLEAVAGKNFIGSAPKEFQVAVFENGIRTEKKQTVHISVLEKA